MALVLAAGPGVLLAQSPGEELEREAQAIDKMIMCPVCPAETIDQAQVEISFQMRAVIREMLAEGRTREEVLDYFVDRYGPDILAAPPKSGANLVAWILPVAGVAAGLAVLLLVVRSMTGPGGTPPPAGAGTRRRRFPGAAAETPGEAPAAPVDHRELAPYLDIVDRNLAARRGMRPALTRETRPESLGSPKFSAEAGGDSPAERRDDG